MISRSSRGKVPPLNAGHPIRRDSTTEIYSVSFLIPVNGTKNSPCSSLTLLPSINLFDRRAVARCASLSDESMLLSLHAPKSRAAHSPRIAMVMSKVGSTDAPWRGDHSAIAFVYSGTSDGARDRRQAKAWSLCTIPRTRAVRGYSPMSRSLLVLDPLK